MNGTERWRKIARAGERHTVEVSQKLRYFFYLFISFIKLPKYGFSTGELLLDVNIDDYVSKALFCNTNKRKWHKNWTVLLFMKSKDCIAHIWDWNQCFTAAFWLKFVCFTVVYVIQSHKKKKNRNFDWHVKNSPHWFFLLQFTWFIWVFAAV